MAYEFNSRVRYSEIGENGCLTLPGVMDYFQDCCTFQSESIGQGIKVMKERGKAWVLSAGQVVVNRYPKMGEEIITATWPYDFHGFIGMRNFTMDTAQGERLAYANTWWSHLDIKKGMPKKLTEEDTAGYTLNPRLDMEYASRKIELPKERQKQEPFHVQKHHLDTNHHVNNCQYIRMAENYLPNDFEIHQMRVEYKQQARLDDQIYPEVTEANGRIVVLLNDGKQLPYAVVEFI